MSDEQIRFGSRLGDFLQRLFALRITEAERIHVPLDPINIYAEDVSSRRPMIVAAILALLAHAILLILYFPERLRELHIDRVVVLADLAEPAGGTPEPQVTPPVEKPKPKPEPTFVPIPDPTPTDPEPIERIETFEISQVVDQVVADFNIGDVVGPPSRGHTRGPGGQGNDVSDGLDGVRIPGQGGVRNPELLKQTLPSYTDDAIRAKVQGTVLLQVVVRKDGSVDNFKVLKPLGYGLDEKAIQEIARNWVFRPGTYNGSPVDVLATIEVSFTLR